MKNVIHFHQVIFIIVLAFMNTLSGRLHVPITRRLVDECGNLRKCNGFDGGGGGVLRRRPGQDGFGSTLGMKRGWRVKGSG
jgi:hypothetical protein